MNKDDLNQDIARITKFVFGSGYITKEIGERLMQSSAELRTVANMFMKKLGMDYDGEMSTHMYIHWIVASVNSWQDMKHNFLEECNMGGGFSHLNSIEEPHSIRLKLTSPALVQPVPYSIQRMIIIYLLSSLCHELTHTNQWLKGITDENSEKWAEIVAVAEANEVNPEKDFDAAKKIIDENLELYYDGIKERQAFAVQSSVEKYFGVNKPSRKKRFLSVSSGCYKRFSDLVKDYTKKFNN